MGAKPCGCCCQSRSEDDPASDNKRRKSEIGDDETEEERRLRRYSCLRKFLAVTCSNLGLLIVIIGYVIGGCFLFSYLERAPQQTRLNQEISQLGMFFKQISEVSNRIRRSTDSDTNNVAVHCVNLQISTLQTEIDNLLSRIQHPYLSTRSEELKRLRFDVEGLVLLNDQQQLTDILDSSLPINFTQQIESFPKSAGRKGKVPRSAILEDLVRSVYKAVIAGWVPPPRQMEPVNASLPGPRALHTEETTGEGARVFQKRLPRSDPWTLSGSLFFVITVITTIGYGQVVPKTMYGRLTTIFYGLFGIPMMLLFLANLGSLMADLFRIAYKNICCRCQSESKVTGSRSESTASASVATPKLPNARTSVNSPALSLRNVPGRSVRPPQGKTSALHQLVKKTAPLPGMSESIFIALTGSDSIFSKAIQARRESRNVRIPVWLILCIFFLYLMLGGLVFSRWEEWSFLDSMYFVFVTISTIGFGDIVPGMNDSQTEEQMGKFVFIIIYLVFGLAIVAMCFDLMQLEVKRKSKHIAKRIGLVSSM